MKASLAVRGPKGDARIGLGCLAVFSILGICLGGVFFIFIAAIGVTSQEFAEARFAPLFWGIVFFVGGAIGAARLAFSIVKSFRNVLVPPNTWGLLSERGQRTANLLPPGEHVVPFSSAVYFVSVPENELRRTVKTVGYSRDGAKFKVQAAYTLTPEPEGLWRIVDSGNHVAIECDQFVQSVITKRLKQFPDWQDALSGEEEIESAVRHATERGTYLADSRESFSGFTLTNCTVIELLPEGELADKSLMSLAKERQDFAKDLRTMADKVDSLDDLYELRDRLRDKYPKRKKDIEDEFERTRIKFKEPR